MANVLVAGASGQLGSSVVEALVQAGHQAIALLRPHAALPEALAADPQVSICRGDLADPSSLIAACERADVVVATASSIVPKKGDRFGSDEVAHYQNLLNACRDQRIEHFIYVSAFSSAYDRLVPEFLIKREIEGLIADSGLRYTIFRCAAFMDIYFATMGSEAPLRGIEKPTLRRGFWLSRLYVALTSGLLERRGVALVPGRGDTVHRFISINTVAAFMARAVDLPSRSSCTLELAGPRGLTWNDIAALYGRRLGQRVRKLRIPLWLFRGMGRLLSRLSPAGSNMMRIFAVLGAHDYDPKPCPALKAYGLPLEDADAYLARQLSRPPL